MIPTAEHWRIREDREYYLEGLRLAAGQRHSQRRARDAAVHESSPVDLLTVAAGGQIAAALPR